MRWIGQALLKLLSGMTDGRTDTGKKITLLHTRTVIIWLLDGVNPVTLRSELNLDMTTLFLKIYQTHYVYTVTIKLICKVNIGSLRHLWWEKLWQHVILKVLYKFCSSRPNGSNWNLFREHDKYLFWAMEAGQGFRHDHKIVCNISKSL